MIETITKYGMEYLKLNTGWSKENVLREYLRNRYPNFKQVDYEKRLGDFSEIGLSIYYKITQLNNIALEFYSIKKDKQTFISEKNGKINLTLLNKKIKESIEEITTKKEKEKLDAKKEEFRNMQDYGHLVKEFPEFEFDNEKNSHGSHGFLFLSGKINIFIFVSVADDRTIYTISIRAKNYLRTEMTLNKEDTRKLLTTLKSLNFL